MLKDRDLVHMSCFGIHLHWILVRQDTNIYSTRCCITCYCFKVFYCLVVYRAPYLLVFTESALEVFDVNSAQWIQTISIKKVYRYM